jgi:hypothetical protein
MTTVVGSRCRGNCARNSSEQGGGAVAEKPKTVAVTARIPAEIYSFMETVAEEKRLTITGVMIAALSEYLETVCDTCGQTVPPSVEKRRLVKK